jgi:hypothetical protein
MSLHLFGLCRYLHRLGRRNGNDWLGSRCGNGRLDCRCGNGRLGRSWLEGGTTGTWFARRWFEGGRFVRWLPSWQGNGSRELLDLFDSAELNLGNGSPAKCGRISKISKEILEHINVQSYDVDKGMNTNICVNNLGGDKKEMENG